MYFLLFFTYIILICCFHYFSHITRQAQYEHPCAPHYIYQPEVRIHMEVQPRVLAPPPRHTHFHPHSVLVPANPYLNEGMYFVLYEVNKNMCRGMKGPK